jgi:hypothetical protein
MFNTLEDIGKWKLPNPVAKLKQFKINEPELTYLKDRQIQDLLREASAKKRIFEVKDRGTGMFPFVLVDNAYRIQLSRPGKKLPMAYIQVSAEYLAHKTPRDILKELLALLTELGTLDGGNTVSRIDLAADFSTPVVSRNSLWSYATTQWLRLTVPNEADSTRSRWPTHHLWTSLASVNWEGPPGVLLDKYSNTRTPTEIRLITVVLGALSSYMAMYKIDNRAEAIDQFLAKLYEHYSLVAARKELTFDEYLAQRVAVKGREFNTAVNSPGLPDNLKQDFLDQGVDAYRRASRG